MLDLDRFAMAAHVDRDHAMITGKIHDWGQDEEREHVPLARDAER